MNKKRSVKHALFMSVMALILSVSCLVGSTYAWFSDSITSGNNIVKAGNLQVDLELLETDGSWTSIGDTRKPIFDYDRWEPGYTEVKILRIRNEGTLALNWVAKFAAKTQLSELANVIDVYISTDVTAYPQNETDLQTWKSVGTVAEFMNISTEILNGSLKRGECSYLGIAFKMHDSVDNRYQGMDLGAFDILVIASQASLESDGFGDDYDSSDSTEVKTYYASFSAALNAIKGGSVSDDASCNLSDAAVTVSASKGGYKVTLLKSISATEPIEITSSVTLVLNGHTVAFENTSKGFVVPQGSNVKFVIDAQAAGSGIQITNDGFATAIEVNAGSCIMKGGTYQSNAKNGGSKSNPNPCIKTSGTASLYMDGVTVTAADEDKGTPNGVYIAEGCNAVITDCDITASAPFGLDVSAINCAGVAEVSQSSLKGYSNYTANAAGTDYATRSMGVQNRGEMIFKDCYVIGTHSGISTNGAILVDGGTYESYGHGGIYFGGSNTTSYVKDATIRWSEVPDGYYDDGIAGTNSAGMYIGGTSRKNIVVYADNCDFYGPAQSIVVRGTSGEMDDVLYISNSTIYTSAKIRIDANNKLCIGLGNNFDETHTRSRTSTKGTIEITNVSYRDIIDAAFLSK